MDREAQIEKVGSDMAKVVEIPSIEPHHTYDKRKHLPRPFIGRLGGNQTFVYDRKKCDEDFLGKRPDAAPGMPWQAQFNLRPFKTVELWKAAVLEGLGTLLFVYISVWSSASPLVLPVQSEPRLGYFDNASYFGPLTAGVYNAILLALFIFAFGNSTGAHLNPTITIATFCARLCTFPRLVLYLGFQMLGATLAGYLLRASYGTRDFKCGGCWLFPEQIPVSDAFVVEFVFCASFLFLVFGVGLDPRQQHVLPKSLSPFLVGITLGVMGWISGYSRYGYGGASLNPARCFGVFIASRMPYWHWTHWTISLPHYPEEDDKLRATGLVRRRGGNCPNTLEVLSQFMHLRPRPVNGTNYSSIPDFLHNIPATTATAPLGERQDTSSLVLCAVLPSRSSIATEGILDSLGPGIDCSLCIYREDTTEAASSYVFQSEENGSRTIANYNELKEMTFKEFVDAVEGLDRGREWWFHFEGRIPDVTLECMRYVRRTFPETTNISVEVEKPRRAGLRELAREADVVFFSKSWAKAAGCNSAEELLRLQAALLPRASLLCCTWGEDGAAVLDTSSPTVRKCRAYVDGQRRVIDTVGAGDTFIAGILYGIVFNRELWDLERTLEFATKLAGCKVLQDGFSGLLDKVGV